MLDTNVDYMHQAFQRLIDLDSVLQAVTKEAVGIRVLLTRLLFGDGIPRRLLRRVSPRKPISVALLDALGASSENQIRCGEEEQRRV